MINEFKNLPPPWPKKMMGSIRELNKKLQTTTVVLDDDPTGTQTVHGVSILTSWDVDTLIEEFDQKPDLFYILTNSRSLHENDAIHLAEEISATLKMVSRATRRKYRVISRSDSTLRGHYPAEIDALFSGPDVERPTQILIPAFLQGGRYTIDDIHYVEDKGILVPAAETPFAADNTFGYKSSNLRDWVEEKTNRRITVDEVESISLGQIRTGGPEAVAQQFMDIKSPVCIINAADESDLEVVSLALLTAEAAGRSFIYRTAASIIPAMTGMTPKPLLKADDLFLKAGCGGFIIVGSYVPKSTSQLNYLLNHSEVEPVEIPVKKIMNEANPRLIFLEIAGKCDEIIKSKRDVVLYTSREIEKGDTAAKSLEIVNRVSQSVVEIVKTLRSKPRYVLAKGGITSSDIATKALGIKRAQVLGQILPGIPVWKVKYNNQELVYIVFPGNVGDENALNQVCESLKI